MHVGLRIFSCAVSYFIGPLSKSLIPNFERNDFHTNRKNVVTLSRIKLNFGCGSHTFVEISHFFVHNIKLKHTWGLKLHYGIQKNVTFLLKPTPQLS